jgi:hypothetical protein
VNRRPHQISGEGHRKVLEDFYHSCLSITSGELSAATSFFRTCPPPEDRDGWSSLDWNAWIVYELFKMLYQFSQGPLYGQGLSEEMACYESGYYSHGTAPVAGLSPARRPGPRRGSSRAS